MSDHDLLRLRREALASPGDEVLQRRLRRQEERAGLRAANPYADPRRREFLDLFPAAQRSHLANVFLGFGRAGGDVKPDEVLAQVRTKLGRTWRGQVNHRDRALLAIVGANNEAALDYAAWCVSFSQLPVEAQRAARDEETERRRPATPKQLAYLVALGWEGDPPSSLTGASALIDSLKRDDPRRRLA